MALQKVFELTGEGKMVVEGITISTGPQTVTLDCYIKIETICGSKDTEVMNVSFTDGTRTFTRDYRLTPSMGNSNSFKEGYLYLKTLPEFADAVDV
jgi:hypothetical protein